MASLLVDYENVQGFQGLKGVEYLNEKDRLIIFYSSSCMKITKEYIEMIRKSGCQFNIYKLKIPRKNALDFYMATEAGRLSALGNNQIALITRDRGFDSISDYFKVNENLKNSRLIVCDSIEQGLERLNDHEDKERRKLIRDNMQQVDIEVEYGKIMELRTIKEKISEVLKDTEYESMTDNIVNFITNNMSETHRNIYNGSLHEFGIKDGVAIYRLLRDVV